MRTLLEDDTGIKKEKLADGHSMTRDVSDKIAYAFQLATAYGPLCQEPMQGVAVILEEVSFASTQDEESASMDSSSKISGDIIRKMRDSIRQGFLDWSPRLLLAMYRCEIQTSSK